MIPQELDNWIIGFFVRAVVLCAVTCAAGCARSGRDSSSYSRAFNLDGRAPRVLAISQETTVPLVVSNTGTQPWNPAAVHVSYHWVWLIPRELPRKPLRTPL